jgi:hypothetical protein
MLGFEFDDGAEVLGGANRLTAQEDSDAEFEFDRTDFSAATTPPRTDNGFSKRKPKALSVRTSVDEVMPGDGSTMWSPSTGIDDLFCGLAAGTNAAPSNGGTKGKTPTSLNVLLDGHQGFVDVGTPHLKMSDMWAPSPHTKSSAEMLNSSLNAGDSWLDKSLENHLSMSAAEISSMMCLTPPKRELIKPHQVSSNPYTLV